MQIEQLTYFCMIVEKKTFSEAAYFLHISQSSLSKQMMKLEQELGAILFDRSKRQIALTAEGQQVYEDALTVLKAYDDLCDNLKRKKEENQKQLHIAMLPVFSQYSLGYYIQSFFKIKDCQGSIREIEERDLPTCLQDAVDMYILRGIYQELQEYTRYASSEDELVAVVGDGHPLANAQTCAFQDLKEESLLLFPRYTMVTKICEEACHRAGFVPWVERYGRMESLLGAARENEGVILAMKTSLSQYQLHGLHVVAISPTIKSCLYIYVKPSSMKKRAVCELLQFLKEKGEIHG